MKTTLLQKIGYTLVVALMVSSCTKDDDPIEDPTQEDTPGIIYVSGYSNEITNMGEVIWKNGTPLQIFNSDLLSAGNVRYGGIVYDMSIVNDDLYAVWRMSYKPLAATYSTSNIYLWGNSNNTLIKENDNRIYPRTVAVQGTDVYFGGYYSDLYEYPSIWKNGNREQLTGGYGSVTDLLVNQTDVYAVGHVRTAQTPIAAQWKNGVLTKLGEGYGFSANGITQSNNDTYVVGEGNINGPNGQRSALLWKNGTLQALENPVGQVGASANGIAITGNKICVAGYSYAGQAETMRAVVWINGTPTILSQIESKANSIAIKGNTVYLCGYEKPGASYIATIWKITGDKVEKTQLSNGTANAEAFCIKVK